MNSKGYILAIHPGHNACALIGNENGVQFCIQEERLTRNKNEWRFPELSIKACLEHVGITSDEVQQVVFGSNRLVLRPHTREQSIQSYARQDTFTGKIRQRILVPLIMQFRNDVGHRTAYEELKKLGIDANKVRFFDHHTSHAYTAYYGLRKDPSEDYLVVTSDGAGDTLCATIRIIGPDRHDIIATTHYNNSIGALYAWTTFRMGFVPLEHEYKLMGMAPYADQRYSDEVKKIYKRYLWLDESGLKYKRKTFNRVSDISASLFKDLKGKRFDSICGGLQSFTEEMLSSWVQNAVRETGVPRVLAAGGVFMNVKANKTISELPEVDYFEAFPSCGDESLTFGAYYQAIAERIGQDAVQPLNDIYLGPDIDNIAAEAIIRQSGYSYEVPEKMAEKVARLLTDGFPVARCAGRMEFGARALGNRSILADPKQNDVVRVINQMIKKRDFWMPFAPMIKKEKSDQYIQNPKKLESPYMMMTFDTLENYTELIAAVQSADLTCRAQLLEESQNEEMYQIIDDFEKLTGRAVVLNTSYNLHGYPLVNDAEDAMFVFKNSGLNYMQLGKFLITKT